MKHILLAIFVLLGTQPLPALGCDLHANQTTMTAEHQHMASHDMNDMAGMDCCDDATDSPDHCASMSQCGACAPGVTALVAFMASSAPNATSHLAILDRDKTALQFYPPLFRPPIS